MSNGASKLTVGPGREERENGAQIFVHAEESVLVFVHVGAGFELKVFGVGSTIACAIASQAPPMGAISLGVTGQWVELTGFASGGDERL
jgi:hypothetical protein